MIETLAWALWFVGMGAMAYGVFAAPSADVEGGWFQKDRPYMKIRTVGAALIFLGLGLLS